MQTTNEVRSASKTIEGYVYVPDSNPEVFAGAAVGKVVRKPDLSPPWIVVDHAIETSLISRWPGRLWRVVVLDTTGLEQASIHAKYTRAVAVKIIEEVPAWRLFGDQGEAVVQVLAFASRLDAAVAERLASHRHAEAGRAYSRTFKKWLSGLGYPPMRGSENFAGVIAAGPGPTGSPINYGFSLIHRVVWERAEVVAGPGAFVDDEEGERALGPVWGGAASALLEAAMAVGAPSVTSADYSVLIAAWSSTGDSTDLR